MQESELVWYVAYGSNMLRARFLAYLTGGHGPGFSGHHDGARNPADPLDDRPVGFDRKLIFAGRSKRWSGGGVCAVVRPDDTNARCLGRAWLVTVDQLLDVWRQENGGTLSIDSVAMETFDDAGHLDQETGRYRRLDRLAPIDGIRAATITCGPELAAERNPPSGEYLEVVRAGLSEAWGLAGVEADSYLNRHRSTS